MSDRKVIVYIATSVDGYIARKDGSVDWLNRPRTAGDYGMGDFLRTVDSIVWGRKTYDLTAGFSKKNSRDNRSSSNAKNYVFTHHPPAADTRGVQFIDEPVRTFAQRIKAETGKNIWIMGGAGIIASFLDAGQIDEFIIHVVPTIIGEGIPLIAPEQRLVPLGLKSSESFPDGVVRLHYSVEAATNSRIVAARKKSSRRPKKAA